MDTRLGSLKNTKSVGKQGRQYVDQGQATDFVPIIWIRYDEFFTTDKGIRF